MKKSRVYCVVVFVLVCISLPVLAQDTGRLALDVSPESAEVFIDGKKYAEGSGVHKLSTGDHVVKISKDGYITEVVTDIIIEENTAYELNFILEEEVEPDENQELINKAIDEGDILGEVTLTLQEPDEDEIWTEYTVYISDVKMSSKRNLEWLTGF